MSRVRALAAAALSLAGCGGAESVLDPAGRGAERIATLFWWMSGGAALIWLAMAALAVWAVRSGPERHGTRSAALLIVGGGVAFPTVVLAALLAWGLSSLPPLLAAPPPTSRVIRVTGEQWWWRVRYGEVELANELRLAVGEPVLVELESADVVHSLWIPALSGKVDAIPGRVTRLTLEPTRTGTFRGVCAEYCGASHALMELAVVVVPPDELERWLADQAAPARAPKGPLAERGAAQWVASGCGACHAVRGTGADGVIGPDLTHVGGRRMLAGWLENSQHEHRRWLARTSELKPGARMPSFGMLAPDELDALAAYLEGLE